MQKVFCTGNTDSETHLIAVPPLLGRIVETLEWLVCSLKQKPQVGNPGVVLKGSENVLVLEGGSERYWELQASREDVLPGWDGCLCISARAESPRGDMDLVCLLILAQLAFPLFFSRHRPGLQCDFW